MSGEQDKDSLAVQVPPYDLQDVGQSPAKFYLSEVPSASS